MVGTFAASLEPKEFILETRKLIEERTIGVDPAPWFEPNLDDMHAENCTDRAAFIRRRKVFNRANLALYRAFISGALRGWFVIGDERRQIPGWAWAMQDADWKAFLLGYRFLPPLLPNEWRRWTNSEISVERKDFDAWLQSSDPYPVGDFPALPVAKDDAERPPVLERLLPPDTPFVTLSESLAWIAFGVSVDRDSLDHAIEAQAFGEVTEAQKKLSAALERLLTVATGGKIGLRGKYVEWSSTNLNHVLTEIIEPIRFADFRQFDILYDGLRYGLDLTWHSNGNVIERIFSPGREDAFRSVTVNRHDLLREFPPPQRPATTTDFAGPSGKIADWIELPPWLNMYQLVAWVQYRALPVVAKSGNWDGLAAQHLYGNELQVGKVMDLELALQEAKISAQGRKQEETFAPIPAVEWTRIRIAPLQLAQQHPYVAIQVKRQDVLSIFPPLSHASANSKFEVGFKASQSHSLQPSVPSPLPSEDCIKSKMLELVADGMKRDQAAKHIRTVPGFENVGNEHARRAATGALSRGRPKKRTNK